MDNRSSRFCTGLDLGQAQDYTAIAAVEKLWGGDDKVIYHLRHLERLPLGTPYPQVVQRVRTILETGPLCKEDPLIMDLTGVGRPVFDLFRQHRFYLIGVTITGGDSVSQEGAIFRVPKRDLVGALQVLFQTGRLKVAASMPLMREFIEELLNFRVKINIKTAHDSYEAWREGVHDDLVLAVALATWYAEKNIYLPRPPQMEEETIISRHINSLVRKQKGLKMRRHMVGR